MWAVVGIALTLGLLQVHDFVTGRIDGGPFLHATPDALVWVGSIHPPGYAALLGAVEVSSEAMGVSKAAMFYVVSAFSGALLVLLVAVMCRELAGPGWGVAGAWLMAWSPDLLRPFEQYPVASAAVLVAVWATTRAVRIGGLSWTLGAVGSCWVACMLHLNAWPILGCLMSALLLRREERRRVAVVGIALVVLYLPVLSMGFVEALDSAVGRNKNIGGPSLVRLLTTEWSNPLLLVTAALALLQGSKVTPGGPAVRAVALAGLGGAVWVFALQGLRIVQGGNILASPQFYRLSHHYFELLTPLLIVATVSAGARLAHAGHGRLRGRLVLAMGLVLMAGQPALRGVHKQALRDMYFHERPSSITQPVGGARPTRTGKKTYMSLVPFLRCIDTHFGDDPEAREAARLELVGGEGWWLSWVDEVATWMSEREAGTEVDTLEEITRRTKQLCPEGGLHPGELSALRLPAPAQPDQPQYCPERPGGSDPGWMSPRHAPLTLVSLLGLGCEPGGPVAPGAPAAPQRPFDADESESNDSVPRDLGSIALPFVVTGASSLCGNDGQWRDADIDLISFAVGESTVVEIHLQATAGDLDMLIFDPDGNLVAQLDTPDDLGEFTTLSIRPGATYTAEIRCWVGAPHSPWRLTFDDGS